MNNLITRYLLLLSGAGFTEKEVDHLMQWLRYVEPAELSGLLKRARSIGRDLQGQFDFYENSRELTNRRGGLSPASDVANRIEVLLRHEAGLTVKEIEKLLMTRIYDIADPRSIPSLGKQSFRSWIRQLLRSIPPNELLHFATSIRNDVVHRSKTSDWPLKKR